MKIAVPTKENCVDAHFGHCEYYTVFTINSNGEVEDCQTLPSPSGCGCKSNIASTLKEMGVGLMLAGNMGDGAVNVLQNNGIKVVRGCSGDVNELVNKYLQGEVSDSGERCMEHMHHGSDHQCNHK